MVNNGVTTLSNSSLYISQILGKKSKRLIRTIASSSLSPTVSWNKTASIIHNFKNNFMLKSLGGTYAYCGSVVKELFAALHRTIMVIVIQWNVSISVLKVLANKSVLRTLGRSFKMGKTHPMGKLSYIF